MEFMVGDRLAFEYHERHQWSTPNDLTIRQAYPQDGNGLNITFVEITTVQVDKSHFFLFRSIHFQFLIRLKFAEFNSRQRLRK